MERLPDEVILEELAPLLSWSDRAVCQLACRRWLTLFREAQRRMLEANKSQLWRRFQEDHKRARLQLYFNYASHCPDYNLARRRRAQWEAGGGALQLSSYFRWTKHERIVDPTQNVIDFSKINSGGEKEEGERANILILRNLMIEFEDPADGERVQIGSMHPRLYAFCRRQLRVGLCQPPSSSSSLNGMPPSPSSPSSSFSLPEPLLPWLLPDNFISCYNGFMFHNDGLLVEDTLNRPYYPAFWKLAFTGHRARLRITFECATDSYPPPVLPPGGLRTISPYFRIRETVFYMDQHSNGSFNFAGVRGLADFKYPSHQRPWLFLVLDLGSMARRLESLILECQDAENKSNPVTLRMGGQSCQTSTSSTTTTTTTWQIIDEQLGYVLVPLHQLGCVDILSETGQELRVAPGGLAGLCSITFCWFTPQPSALLSKRFRVWIAEETFCNCHFDTSMPSVPASEGF
jgi:hypothetical protein